MRRTVLLVLALLLVAGSARAVKVSDLPAQWRKWLEEEVYPLITVEQRKTFLALESDAERADFAERLWVLWGDQYGLGTSFRRNYLDRLEQCRSEYSNTTEDRARVLLIQGPPEAKKTIDCDKVFQPLEFWQWQWLEGLGQNVVIVFYRPYGLGRFKLWDPVVEGRSALYNFGGWSALQAWMGNSGNQLFPYTRPEYSCGDTEIMRLIEVADYWLRDVQAREAMQHAPLPPEGRGAAKESASARFLQFSTVVPKGSSPFNFDLASALGSRRGSKLAVTFSAKVPRAGLETNKVGDVDVVQLDVTGEISSGGEMADRFRYAFTFPTAGATEFPVQIERELHPGKYHLRMKVQDGNSTHAAVKEIDVDVPAQELPAISPADPKADEALKGKRSPGFRGSPPWSGRRWRGWSSTSTPDRCSPRTVRLTRLSSTSARSRALPPLSRWPWTPAGWRSTGSSWTSTSAARGSLFGSNRLEWPTGRAARSGHRSRSTSLLTGS